MIKRRNQESGFTLIELMIVIAIIGILAAVAIPAYQDYIGRSQVAEPISLMGGMKAPIVEWYSNQGSFPTFGTDITVTSTGKYTAAIVISTASVTTAPGTLVLQATMPTSGVNAAAAGASITMTSTNGGGTWACTGATAIFKFLPNSCR